MSVFYIFDIVIIALVVFRPIFLLLNTYLLIRVSFLLRAPNSLYLINNYLYLLTLIYDANPMIKELFYSNRKHHD